MKIFDMLKKRIKQEKWLRCPHCGKQFTIEVQHTSVNIDLQIKVPELKN